MSIAVILEATSQGDTQVLTPQCEQLLKKVVLNAGAMQVCGISTVEIDPLQLQKLGVDKLIVAKTELNTRIANVYADCVISALEQLPQVKAIFVTSSYAGKELAGFLSVKLNIVAITDVNDFNITQDGLTATKLVLNSSYKTTLAVKNTAVITVQNASVDQEQVAPSEKCQVQITSVQSSPASEAIELLSSHHNQNSGKNLETAQVVVCAGRGVEGDMSTAKALADKLDAALGVTRVVADEGWADRSLQIGQTGKTINAKLYIGLAVSGAVHHTCAIQACENIVAICDDEDAPIFEICDFGIVGDINEVVPQLLQQI